MIRLENLSKSYLVNGKWRVVAECINATFPTGASVALLGRNGAGKSSLLRMIAGTMDPSYGHVVLDGTVSWPVGFAGSFHPDLTGAQNVRFLARVYGVDTNELVEFVADFAELGEHFRLPFRTYSSGMRSRLAFGVSMGMHFDTYLVDEVTAVGDAAFKAKSEALLRERLKTSGAIIASHAMGMIRKLCDCGAVLDSGRMQFFEDVEMAIAQHDRNMAVTQGKVAAPAGA